MMLPILRSSAVLAVAALVLGTPAALRAQIPAPHDLGGGTGCLDCHTLHGGPEALVPHDLAQGVVCKGCHNPAGQASAKSDVAVHEVNGGATIIDCGACHDIHVQPAVTDPHSGGQTAPNLSLVRFDTTDYVAAAVQPAVFQTRPDHFAFTAGDAPYVGICQTCHTTTAYHRNDGTGDYSHNAGSDCATCHTHGGGFVAGGDPRHKTHTSSARGPSLSCTAGNLGCHGANTPPLLSDGNDLATTGVCTVCHSPGGSYDGLNDPLIGAKSNWTTGVYAGDALQTGKGRWCVGCHDESPANSRSDGSGVDAPNISGDEAGAFSYGTGWGYYETGHGLPGAQGYPSSGGTVAGAGLECDACHDLGATHIDHDARTFFTGATLGSANDYEHGYRLATVGGDRPLVVPRLGYCGQPDPVLATDFALCFQCHDAGAFTGQDLLTNFRRTGALDHNAHNSHLAVNDVCSSGPMASADWSYSGWDSRATCPTCHNVHGSTQLAMVRDGRLVDRTPGLELVYYDPSVTYVCGGPSAQDPTPADVLLPDSTGTVYNSLALTGVLCNTCHSSCGYDALYLRTPVDLNPPAIVSAYGRAGRSNLSIHFSEPVYSSPGAVGAVSGADLALTDLDDGRSITSVSHVAGEAWATLALDTALDGSADLGTDTLAAATVSSIYDGASSAMPTTSVTIVEDGTAPEISARAPANGVTGIAVDTSPSFTLDDSEAGLDWTTFSINLGGDGGYSRSYTDLDPEVTVTGGPSSLEVGVNPDANFGAGEQITVVVAIDDLMGNALAPPSWSFTAASGATWRTPDAAVASTFVGNPENLIDEDTGTGNTFGGGGPNHIVDYRLAADSSPFTVSAVRIFGSPAYTFTQWQVFVSDDGIDFTRVGVDFTVGGASQWYVYVLPVPTSARYLRTNNWHGGAEIADTVFEFDFEGTP